MCIFCHSNNSYAFVIHVPSSILLGFLCFLPLEVMIFSLNVVLFNFGKVTKVRKT